jgi:hypothetical protein
VVSIEIKNGAEGYVRNLVPVGVECYLVGKRGQRYLNVRTHDLDLIERLKAAACM